MKADDWVLRKAFESNKFQWSSIKISRADKNDLVFWCLQIWILKFEWNLSKFKWNLSLNSLFLYKKLIIFFNPYSIEKKLTRMTEWDQYKPQHFWHLQNKTMVLKFELILQKIFFFFFWFSVKFFFRFPVISISVCTNCLHL